MTGQQEYRITDEEVGIIEIALKSDKHCKKCPYEGDGFNQGVKSFLRSRPVQASQDSNLNEQGVYWYLEGIKTLKELRDIISTHPKNNTTLTAEGIIALEMQLNFIIKCFPPLHPIPTDEQCRICEQAIRKDEREKTPMSDQDKHAYAEAYRLGGRDATGKVLDYLEDYMRREEINDERTPYESFVWILHQVIPSLRKGGEQE